VAKENNMWPVQIAKDAVAKLFQGHTTVGANIVQISSVSIPLKRGVILRTPGASDTVPNSDVVWISPRSNVTANSAAATDGFPLVPGASITLEIDDVSKLYAVSESASQDVAWIGM
jgi:hypothetical protein